jgi:predicted DNA-binding transcriptional regulator YafY
MERMMRIHEKLKADRFPNCRQLAGQIEVSIRTIKRDVDFMKYRLDLPIEYNAKRYGYYYSEDVEQFPSVPLTEAELFALLVAHKAISQYQGTPYERPLGAAFEKLTSRLEDKQSFTMSNLEQALSFRPFAPSSVELEDFQIITRALAESRALSFRYKKLGASRAQTRRIHGYHLACVDNQWYLIGHDLARDAMRTFSLARLSDAELLPDAFERPTDFDINDYLAGSFGIFKAGDDFEVVLEFDKWAAQLVSERNWHPSQQLTNLAKGAGRMTLRLDNLEEVERWVLSWGAHCTVIRPKRLVQRVLKAARSLLKKYEG